MKVVRGSINKIRIEKARMTVIPRGLNITVESRHRDGSACPGARLRSRSTIIKVVINHGWRLVFVDLRSVQRYEAAGPRIDDVVLENIVCHVPLHLELTRAGCRRIVFVESVVDHRGVHGVPSLRRITSDGNTGRVAVIDKIIPRSDIAGGA